jgi:hypothetical protein
LSSRESRKVSRRCRARACVGTQPLTPLDRRRGIFIPNINWQIAVASAVTAGATGVGTFDEEYQSGCNQGHPHTSRP